MNSFRIFLMRAEKGKSTSGFGQSIFFIRINMSYGGQKREK